MSKMMQRTHSVARIAMLPLAALLIQSVASPTHAQGPRTERGPCGETIDTSPPPPGWARIGIVRTETVVHRAGPQVCEWTVDLVQYEERRSGHVSRHQRYEYTLIG